MSLNLSYRVVRDGEVVCRGEIPHASFEAGVAELEHRYALLVAKFLRGVVIELEEDGRVVAAKRSRP